MGNYSRGALGQPEYNDFFKWLLLDGPNACGKLKIASVKFMEHREGIEPSNTGFADQRVSHFAIGALLIEQR